MDRISELCEKAMKRMPVRYISALTGKAISKETTIDPDSDPRHGKFTKGTEVVIRASSSPVRLSFKVTNAELAGGFMNVTVVPSYMDNFYTDLKKVPHLKKASTACFRLASTGRQIKKVPDIKKDKIPAPGKRVLLKGKLKGSIPTSPLGRKVLGFSDVEGGGVLPIYVK